MEAKKTGGLRYFTWGSSPKLLITSGLHGDETETSDLLLEYMQAHYQDLPSFVYIPYMSPTATQKKTRENGNGLNLNRAFTQEATDSEALDIIAIVQNYSFDLALDFHEDPDRKYRFYLYDESFGRLPFDHRKFKRDLKHVGLQLYNGIEDPADPTLGYTVKKGYIHLGQNDHEEHEGFFSYWALNHGIMKRCFTFETPGKTDRETKKMLIKKLLAFGLKML